MQRSSFQNSTITTSHFSFDMKYTLKKTSSFSYNYKNYAQNKNIPKDSIVTHECNDVFVASSKEVIIDIIKSELDVPDYELTRENIKKEFLFNTEVSAKSFEHIFNYYDYRKRMFVEIVKWIETQKGEDDYFHFEIPYEYNHFEIIDNEMSNSEIQNKYSFELNVSEK
jgi:hypothetical protein